MMYFLHLSFTRVSVAQGALSYINFDVINQPLQMRVDDMVKVKVDVIQTALGYAVYPFVNWGDDV